MSKKLLNEGTIRRFMKLAALKPIADNVIREMSYDYNRDDEEEGEVILGAEEDVDVLPPEEEVPAEGSDNEDLLKRVVQAVAAELDVEVEIEGAEGEADLGDLEGDLEGDLNGEEEEFPEEELSEAAVGPLDTGGREGLYEPTTRTHLPHSRKIQVEPGELTQSHAESEPVDYRDSPRPHGRKPLDADLNEARFYDFLREAVRTYLREAVPPIDGKAAPASSAGTSGGDKSPPEAKKQGGEGEVGDTKTKLPKDATDFLGKVGKGVQGMLDTDTSVPSKTNEVLDTVAAMLAEAGVEVVDDEKLTEDLVKRVAGRVAKRLLKEFG